MTDIIVIAPEVFIKRRLASSDALIGKKYQEIYTKYSCFSAQTNAPVHGKFNNHQENGGFHGHKGRSNYFNRKAPNREDERPAISRKPKDITRLLMGILNVINRNNYNKMLNKIRLLKTEGNISLIIDEILKTCTLQTFYISIYMKLLHDIMEHCSEGEKTKVRESFAKFVAIYMDNTEWLMKNSPIENEDYSAFCDFQKTKNIILAKNMVIMELTKTFALSVNLNKYVACLVHDLNKLVDDNDDDKASIVLQMLVYIAKHNASYLDDINVSSLFARVSSKKNSFVIEELADIIDQKIEAYDLTFSKPSMKASGMCGTGGCAGDSKYCDLAC